MKAVPWEKLKGAQKLISFARHGGSTRQILWGAMIAGTCRSQPCFSSQRGTPNFKGQGWLKDFWGFEIFNVGIFGGGLENFGKYLQSEDSW